MNFYYIYFQYKMGIKIRHFWPKRMLQSEDGKQEKTLKVD